MCTYAIGAWGLRHVGAAVAGGDRRSGERGGHGGRSRFVVPQLAIEQWRSDVAKSPYGPKVNYVSAGSTFGRQQYIQGSVDFGVSDIPFQPDEVRAVNARPFTYVTVSAGAVGFMYNLRDTAGKRIGFSAANGGNDKQLKARGAHGVPIALGTKHALE